MARCHTYEDRHTHTHAKHTSSNVCMQLTLCVLSPAISFLHLAWVRTEWIGLPHPKSMCVHTLESQVTPALASYNGPCKVQLQISSSSAHSIMPSCSRGACSFLLCIELLPFSFPRSFSPPPACSPSCHPSHYVSNSLKVPKYLEKAKGPSHTQ
eukprot:1137170-Pelagomonas_calceolata.AAC.5